MALQRVSIGFYGTQVLAVRIEDSELERLLGALGENSWHDLAVDDGRVRLNLAQVVYVRTERDEPRVGFGA